MTRFVHRPVERWIMFAGLLGPCLAGCVVATGGDSRPLDSKAEINTPTSKRRIEVRVQANAQGRFVLEGRINNHPVQFLLDTGATDVAIPADLAPQLALAEVGLPEPIDTASGFIVGERTQIKVLSLGDIVLRDVRAVLVPELSGHRVLLGMSALKQLEFIQRDGILILRQWINTYHE